MYSVVHSVRFLLLPAIATLSLLTSLRPAVGAESLGNPFPEGRPVWVIQGYEGSTHQGRSRYGLDLALVGADSSEAEVVSPVEGSVTWAQEPGGANGCLGIAFNNGEHTAVLCHVIHDHHFQRGESVSRGQRLGTVGPPNTVGNNGAPHVHLELHRGRSSNNPVPFNLPDGLPLEGVGVPAH